MKPADRTRLTTALREHVARVAEDLRAQMQEQGPRASGPVRERAKALHADEQVGEAFDVWTDLLARRAAVLWVLKSVYVRVLEDRGLLAPGRILDGEAQQLFERLAPNLGETAFLRWVYRDLASPQGGLPELFSPQPAEIAVPADSLSRGLLGFWRDRDPDSGAHWSFAEERFEGELMGDLYQELDPVVKARFALCQTPDFVRAFILDRTLTPAIQTFGAAEVRLLDPACGSGHFLIDGLKRLVAATAEQHQDWERKRLVTQCLGRVVGIDLNDYACALARARLVMTAAELAGVGTLAEASQFHPHVYWADGLEQVEKGKDTRGQQLDLFDLSKNETPRGTLTRPEVRTALRTVLEPKFHAVVANPPYIVETDQARKEYHREKVGRCQRYVSAYRQYSLASPFTERCFQLAGNNAFVGIIASNNFMKRDCGKPLIEKVFAGLDLTLVVDTSQAYIPFHGTPTALLFGRNRTPGSDSVRAVMGKRRESGTPADPAKGRVWSSIADGWQQVGFENEYVSVSNLPRETLGRHPWSIGGGGAAELKERLDAGANIQLGRIASAIGPMCITKQDEVLSHQIGFLERSDVAASARRFYVSGDNLRDWSLTITEEVVFPYDQEVQTLPLACLPGVESLLWPWRTTLGARAVFGGGTFRTAGRPWWEYGQIPADRLATPLSIAFAFVTTHNHFVLDRGGKVFNRSAPVIKLSPTATEDDHLVLIGLLNSSIACFWMKQVFHPKTHASQRHHPDPARAVYEFAATGLQSFPVPDMNTHGKRFLGIARLLDDCAQRRMGLLDSAFVADSIRSARNAADLTSAFSKRWYSTDLLRERMVGLQEELDWLSYVAFGLAGLDCLLSPDRYDELTCPRGGRPFERLHARASTVRAGGKALAVEEGEVPPVGDLPNWAEPIWQRREAALRESESLKLIESPVFKRAWRETEQNIAEGEYRARKDEMDLRAWLADRAETWAAARSTVFTIEQMTAALQDDRAILIVAEALFGRPDFSLQRLMSELLNADVVPMHPAHVYTEAGLQKRSAWEKVWDLQRREDTGEKIDDIPVPPEYSQGSRGKSTDFLKTEYWRLRGKLDVPKERFIAFTEVPGREGADTLYGWAGWTPLQRLKATLTIDEGLEDDGVPLADRIALLDSAWRLLPDLAREDPAAANRLKAEVQALVGTDGPSKAMLDDWRQRFPPPGGRANRRKGKLQ